MAFQDQNKTSSHGKPSSRKLCTCICTCTIMYGCSMHTIYIYVCPQLTCTTDSFLNPSRKRARATCPLYSSSKSLSMCSLQSERQYILEFGNMQIVLDFAIFCWLSLSQAGFSGGVVLPDQLHEAWLQIDLIAHVFDPVNCSNRFSLQPRLES